VRTKTTGRQLEHPRFFQSTSIYDWPMKFREERPFADGDAAVKKLLEIANGVAADHAGRLSVGIINTQFKDAGGSYPEYSAAVKA
jgi:hypothetical protein